MSDVTRVLEQCQQGDPRAAEQLLPLVYDELRKLAAQKLADEVPAQTLQATALVHEAYLRLVAPADDNGVAGAPDWDSRGHFFAAAAEAMRRILINRARDKGRVKRGGGWRRINLDRVEFSLNEPSEDFLDLNDALDKLAMEDPDCAQLVKLRYFAGLTLDDAAKAMGVVRRTADRYWAYARSWLYAELRNGDDAAEG